MTTNSELEAEVERLRALIEEHDALRELGKCPSPIEFYEGADSGESQEG